MMQGTSAAQELVRTIHSSLEVVEQQIRLHAYLHALEEGRIPSEQLRRFVGEQFHIISQDQRSIALMTSRCESHAGRQFFIEVLQGEGAALDALEPLAAAVGMSPVDLAVYEPVPGAQAYSAYLASLCLYASEAEVAAALSINFSAWGANCGRMVRSLRQRYALPEAALRFFAQFAAAPRDPSPQVLALIETGLERGVEARRIMRAARMLQGYELMFWDTVYALSTEAV